MEQKKKSWIPLKYEGNAELKNNDQFTVNSINVKYENNSVIANIKNININKEHLDNTTEKK